MSQSSIVLSSDAGCAALASRVLRDSGALKFSAVDNVLAVLRPVARRMAAKGKLRRVDVHHNAMAIYRDLMNHPNVLLVDVGRHSRSHTLHLSSNDVFAVRCLFTYVPAELPHQSSVLAVNVSLGRRNVTVRVTDLDFSVSVHALARFMRREQKTATSFVAGLPAAMVAAPLLGSVACQYGTVPLALPMGEGLLFGQAHLLDLSTTQGRSSLVVTFDEAGEQHDNTPASAKIVVNSRTLCDIRTFIDGDSMGERKSRLHRLLSCWRTAHASSIARVFEGYAYGQYAITDGDAPDLGTPEGREAVERSIQDGAAAAMEDARRLINSDIWRDYVRNIAPMVMAAG